MKTSVGIFCTIVALAACGVPAAAAPDADTHPIMFRVSVVEKHGATLVKPGDHTATVYRELGTPDNKLARHVWLFHNFAGNHAGAADHACRTLVVVIEEDRVASLALMNRRAVVALRDQPARLERALIAMK